MQRLKCDENCLECKHPKCKHDIYDEHKDLDKRYERVRHAQYYQTHKEKIKEKQREYCFKNRNSEKCHEYYIRHKEEINRKNREQYRKKREERLAKSKIYYQENKEIILARRKERRVQKKNEV